MLQYILYFIAGGALVTLVAYLANRGNPSLTILVGNIPVLFLLNTFLVYGAGGVSGFVTYARGALTCIPVFIAFVCVTMWLLPRLGMSRALLVGVSVYIIPALVYHIRKHIKSRDKSKKVDNHQGHQIESCQEIGAEPDGLNSL